MIFFFFWKWVIIFELYCVVAHWRLLLNLNALKSRWRQRHWLDVRRPPTCFVLSRQRHSVLLQGAPRIWWSSLQQHTMSLSGWLLRDKPSVSTWVMPYKRECTLCTSYMSYMKVPAGPCSCGSLWYMTYDIRHISDTFTHVYLIYVIYESTCRAVLLWPSVSTYPCQSVTSTCSTGIATSLRVCSPWLIHIQALWHKWKYNVFLRIFTYAT